MRTSELIEIFKDTLSRIESDPALKAASESSCLRTKVYGEGFFSPEKTVKSSGYCVKVAEDTSFDCARGFLNGSDRIAVLNFANPFEPGGGVRRGARAQEECLCRCSDLFNSIGSPKMKELYYDCHNADRKNLLFSDRIIYSPDVSVFRADGTYELLEKPFKVDVITCAAPFNVYGHDRELLRGVYRRRLKNIFEAAADNGVDVLILGAFGCGVFRNPPELMAEAFRELIRDEYYAYFKTICFPPVKSIYNKNHEVFSRTLGNEV